MPSEGMVLNEGLILGELTPGRDKRQAWLEWAIIALLVTSGIHMLTSISILFVMVAKAGGV